MIGETRTMREKTQNLKKDLLNLRERIHRRTHHQPAVAPLSCYPTA
jgi:hypothetical protein